MKNLAAVWHEDAQQLNDIEKLEMDIAGEFEIVHSLGREMLRRRRENIKMRGNRMPGPRYLHDLSHIGFRLADRLLSVHGKLSRLIALWDAEYTPVLSDDGTSPFLTLRYIERIERNLRRWDNVRYRLTMH